MLNQGSVSCSTPPIPGGFVLPPPGKLILVCAKCDSGNIVDDYDTINRINEKKCLSCGSRKVKEVAPEQKEAEPAKVLEIDEKVQQKKAEVTDMADKKKCTNCNEKYAHIEGLCDKCFHKIKGYIYKPKKNIGRHTAAAPDIENKSTENAPDQTVNEVHHILKKPPAFPLILTVDFSEHPDLLEQLQPLAKNDFRSPEEEMLFMFSTWVHK
jgi:hypothetical protein